MLAEMKDIANNNHLFTGKLLFKLWHSLVKQFLSNDIVTTLCRQSRIFMDGLLLRNLHCVCVVHNLSLREVKQNALWELVNKIHPKLAEVGFGE